MVELAVAELLHGGRDVQNRVDEAWGLDPHVLGHDVLPHRDGRPRVASLPGPDGDLEPGREPDPLVVTGAGRDGSDVGRDDQRGVMVAGLADLAGEGKA